MIFPELSSLYDRLINEPEFMESIPLQGKSVQRVSFIVILDTEGNLVDIKDAKVEKTTQNGKNEIVPKKLVVCGSSHSTSKITPCFLWDKPEYIFGYCTGKTLKKEKDEKKKEKTREKARTVLFPAYRDYHLKFLEKFSIKDKGYNAVCRFLKNWNPDNISDDIMMKLDKYVSEGKSPSDFGVFQINGENKYVYMAEEIQNAWNSFQVQSTDGSVYGMALDTGEENVELARLVEPLIKLKGKGAALVSFNKDSFKSYGKEQSFNSPISQQGAFKACNAINALLTNSKHHIRLMDTKVIFWTGKKTPVEDSLAWLMGEPPAENDAMDAATILKMNAFWKTVANAAQPIDALLELDETIPFYMLGMEQPNDGRITVRFWHESTLGDFLERLRSHYWALHIEKRFENDSDHLSLYQILRETVRDVKDVPPLLPGALLRAIVEGLPYPTSLYQMVLNRVNVSHADSEGKYRCGSKVTYGQAAIIKAFLVRNLKHGEINMSLNPENKAPAYLLGRLFATLEKTQDEASGGVNAGIGDKFYSAASATPRIVFPTLLDLFRKHLKKLEADRKGLAIVREKLVTDLLDDIDSTQGFPANLTLEDRGMFALGYYQQHRAFFSGKGNSNEATQENNN